MVSRARRGEPGPAFPWRIAVDPYLAFGHVRETAAAPFYDWLLGLIAWLAGGGSPSESLLHVIAAWYPAVLGVFTVAAVFLLARLVFGLRAGLLASAVIATLPGHFLRVSSLGFTDHHVMESLLVTLFFFLLLRAIQRSRFALARHRRGTSAGGLSAHISRRRIPGRHRGGMGALQSGPVVLAWGKSLRSRSGRSTWLSP